MDKILKFLLDNGNRINNLTALLNLIQLIGFTKNGVYAKSLAAKIQSIIGNIPRGSIFARLQSFGAKDHYLIF